MQRDQVISACTLTPTSQQTINSVAMDHIIASIAEITLQYNLQQKNARLALGWQEIVQFTQASKAGSLS